MSSVTVVLLVLLAAETATLVVLAVLFRKAKKAAKVRRVEAPNSEYRSPYVLDVEARERWEGIALENLHEVNREEVVKLVEKVRAEGVRELSKGEREFLDRMAEAARPERRPDRREDARASAREIPRTT